MSENVFRTELCDLLGIDYPIMLAAMAPDVSDPTLVAAVSEAGGIGVLACADKSPDEIRELAAETRKLTDRPFGIDVALPIKADALSLNYREALAQADLPEAHVRLRDEFMAANGIPYVDDISAATPGLSSVAAFKLGYEFGKRQVEAILDIAPALFVSALGDPSFMVADAHARGIKVMSVVGRSKDARRVARGGVDAVICTGTAAGGHSGAVDGMVLVPEVAEMVAPTLVVAGGGIVDGRGLAGALALGAVGVWVGSRFIASEECAAKPWYKQQLIEADDMATVRNRWYTGKTTRHIEGAWDRACEASGLEPLDMPAQGICVAPMTLGAVEVGEYVSSGIYCGQGTARIDAVLPVRRIVSEMIEDARHILTEELPGRIRFD
ncbi:MAG: nitronate monooxygenase [Alphaproteobacteria bacterium]|jgi:NAD(P)H-dependent flavin oxidoreductase YrpB (nitropropane dioxygenase family)|nr:nitronate monooxygenase [Alphaproteobacteria bacterium]